MRGGFVCDLGEVSPYFEFAALYDGQATTMLAYMKTDDSLQDDAEYRQAWRGYLRFYQMLRRLPGAWFTTKDALEQGYPYTFMLDAAEVGAATWGDIDEIAPEFLGLAHALMDAGVDEPMIGYELEDGRGDVWAEAVRMAERRVAVCSKSDVEDVTATHQEGWQVFFVEDLADDSTPLRLALREDGENHGA